jgi:hypothetical protein
MLTGDKVQEIARNLAEALKAWSRVANEPVARRIEFDMDGLVIPEAD